MKGLQHILPLLLLALSLSHSCYKELVVEESAPIDERRSMILLDGIPVFEDLTDKLLLYTIKEDSFASFSPLVEFNSLQAVSINGISLTHGEVNDIGPVEINKVYKLIAGEGSSRDSFDLVFTTLPILRFITDKGIPNEPKIESHMQLAYANPDKGSSSTLLFESWAGIEIRGMSASLREKKAYGFELWHNEFRVDRSVPLLGMGYCEDWILDAMYIDHLRMRNKFSFELWNKMETRQLNDLQEEKRTGIQMEYVELFLNERYYGLYCLGERMDDQLIDFSYSQDEKGGVMYKTFGWHEGSTTFYSHLNDPVPSLEWDGWEQIYPEDFFNWNPLSELRKLVTLTEDEVFIEQIDSQLDLRNTANFYLLLNMIMGWDNTGKNIFLARYNEHSKFFFLPWDLEATWGRNAMMEDAKPNGVVYNGLHQRLIEVNPNGYKDSVSLMWDTYRNTILHKDTLNQALDIHYSLLKKNGVIQRENERWDMEIDHEQEYIYMLEWIEERLRVLDAHF